MVPPIAWVFNFWLTIGAFAALQPSLQICCLTSTCTSIRRMHRPCTHVCTRGCCVKPIVRFQAQVTELVLQRFQSAETADLPALLRFLLQHVDSQNASQVLHLCALHATLEYQVGSPLFCWGSCQSQATASAPELAVMQSVHCMNHQTSSCTWLFRPPSCTAGLHDKGIQ